MEGRIRKAGGGRKKAVGDGCELSTGSGGVVGAQRGSDEPDQIDVAFPDAASQGTLPARTSYQEDGAGRRTAQARLFAQGEQENDGRHVSCRSRSAVWVHHGPVPAVRAEAGRTAISVDCKKKELLGTFKNQGREWQPKGQETQVNVYDYRSLANGKAIPYGIYDLVHNNGFVNVGIDHEAAEFAVESIRRWWKHCGKGLYPQAHALLITADGGGSNGVRNKLWKKALQTLATQEQLLPPFLSFPSIGGPNRCTSLKTVIALISHTTTEEGLQVTAIKDSQTYPTGLTYRRRRIIAPG